LHEGGGSFVIFLFGNFLLPFSAKTDWMEGMLVKYHNGTAISYQTINGVNQCKIIAKFDAESFADRFLGKVNLKDPK
jgi:hypothetical protein